MERKIAGVLSNFESIKAHAREIQGSLNKFEGLRIRAKSSSLPPFHEVDEIKGLEEGKVEETKMVLDEYQRSSSDVYDVLEMHLQYFPPPTSVVEAKGTLRQMAMECDRVIGALKPLITPISREEADKLDKYRSDVASLTAELDINYERNLNEAIDEFESGHYLASALITGRVIIYILDQIKGKTDEEKIQFLQNREIIEKRRKDLREFIIKAGKKARNFLSHDMKISADSSDALGMLGDSVKLLGILAKLKE